MFWFGFSFALLLRNMYVKKTKTDLRRHVQENYNNHLKIHLTAVSLMPYLMILPFFFLCPLQDYACTFLKQC